MTKRRRSRWTVSMLALAATLTARGAHAGPPLICQANDIGNAPSLPWGTGPNFNQPRADYDPARLIDDTLGLLTPTTPVLVRMETLRRATLYAQRFTENGRSGLAGELLVQLQARVLDAEARGDRDPLAWFDAGYLAGSMEAWSVTRARRPHAGYAWVVRASGARGTDPSMELAAALMSLEPPSKPDGHWARARAGGAGDPLLERNLAVRLGTAHARN